MKTFKQERWQAVCALRFTLLLFVALLVSGCRICADCEDLAYPAYGGAWQRTIRDSGRVGSLFDPAGGRAAELVARDQPVDVVEQERQRYKQRNADRDDSDDSLDEELDDSADESDDEDPLKERNDRLKERELDEIENPKEREQRQKQLDEIDVKVIEGKPAPPTI